jgi:hypothetical protein
VPRGPPAIGSGVGLTFSLKMRLKVYHMPTEAWEASMKDIATALLATLFVLISLISLISADPASSGAWGGWSSNEARVSELELRYALKR